ncbi:MAG: rhomboid family intramembrane serine protease [Verrucomicrobia bacterium]|nr:rhomboid family intramembrane serine protease [Verrucomicrobiota bacterium]
MTTGPELPRDGFRRALVIVGGLLLAMWAVELVDAVGGRWLELDRFGIRPRQTGWLPGILLAPFLHAGWAHLAANSIPFLVLGLLVSGHGEGRFWGVTAGIVVLGGLGVWLIGKSGTVHVGASGLIFGYFGYLVAAGWVERSLAAVLQAVIVVALYGSILWGVLPTRAGVSWEGHLCGLLAGIAIAFAWRKGQDVPIP